MKTKRRGLGRGLDALLGGTSETTLAVAETAAVSRVGPATLAVGELVPNRFQPRTDFDDSGLEELAESIRSQGIVQPVVVTAREDGRYTIVAGERRWRAAQLAELNQVPVVVREVADDQQLLELALVENLQRADLNPVEEAEAFRTLNDKFGLSQEAVAKKVGKGRTTVTNALRLLRLPAKVQDLLRSGRLTAGQARPLLALDPKRQLEIAEQAVEKGLTARDLEALAAQPKALDKPARKEQTLDVHAQAAQERLTQALQTKVQIVRRRRGGVIQVHFHSEEELIRLYDRLHDRKGASDVQ